MLSSLFVTGIDGSGKTSCADLLISRLNGTYRIVKIDGGDPYMFFNGEKKQLLRIQLYNKLQQVRPKLEKYGLGGGFLLLHFAYKLLVMKYVTKFVKTDFIVYDTDMLLHPAAYSTLHFPWINRLNQMWRFKTLYKLFGTKKNGLIFYLDIDPALAIERIVKRNRPRDPHENVSDLKELKREFDNILNTASTSGLDIVRIDTNNRTVESVTGEMEKVLKDKIPAFRELSESGASYGNRA